MSVSTLSRFAKEAKKKKAPAVVLRFQCVAGCACMRAPGRVSAIQHLPVLREEALFCVHN